MTKYSHWDASLGGTSLPRLESISAFQEHASLQPVLPDAMASNLGLLALTLLMI